MPGAPDCTSCLVAKRSVESLQERIDRLGFGRFQMVTLLCTGGLMMAEGSEMLIMGSVTTLLDKEWDLSNVVRALMVSNVFVGFGLGNLLSGSLGDRYGRRPTILLSYLMVGCFGVLTSAANSAFAMLVLRFCVGLGCGLGFPSIYSLIPEICPTHLRGAVSAAMIGFMPLGEIFASACVMLIDSDLEGVEGRVKWLKAVLPEDSWRKMCMVSALPSFVFLVACFFFLWESPCFLARQGQTEELEAVLAAMASWNGKPEEILPPSRSQAVRPASERPSFSWTGAIGTLFSERFRSTTLIMFMAHFTKDFSVFGLAYVFPQYFKEMSSPMTAGQEMMLISCLALPGVLLAVLVMQLEVVGNITLVSSLAFACGVACWGLLESFPSWLHDLSACLVKLLALSYFIATVVYTAEVFPTSIRNSAVGLCTCCGRAGSILAPLVFELTPNFNAFLCLLIACLWTVAVNTRCFLSIETKGQPLAEEPQQVVRSASLYGAVVMAKGGGRPPDEQRHS